MTQYRRTSVAGATWFFTVNLARRRTTLLTDRINDLRNGLLPSDWGGRVDEVGDFGERL